MRMATMSNCGVVRAQVLLHPMTASTDFLFSKSPDPPPPYADPITRMTEPMKFEKSKDTYKNTDKVSYVVHQLCFYCECRRMTCDRCQDLHQMILPNVFAGNESMFTADYGINKGDPPAMSTTSIAHTS